MGGAYSTTRTEKGKGSVYRPSRPRHIARATVVTETPGSTVDPANRNELSLSRLTTYTEDPNAQGGS
jgi:hypothetical protein